MHYTDLNTGYIQNNEKLENHEFLQIKFFFKFVKKIVNFQNFKNSHSRFMMKIVAQPETRVEAFLQPVSTMCAFPEITG